MAAFHFQQHLLQLPEPIWSAETLATSPEAGVRVAPVIPLRAELPAAEAAPELALAA
jgi:hypothetical protein